MHKNRCAFRNRNLSAEDVILFFLGSLIRPSAQPLPYGPQSAPLRKSPGSSRVSGGLTMFEPNLRAQHVFSTTHRRCDLFDKPPFRGSHRTHAVCMGVYNKNKINWVVWSGDEG
jgi:hypothetical protein